MEDTVKELYIQRVLTMSTGHITLKDSTLLARWEKALDCPFWTIPTTYGWMVWVDTDSIPVMLEQGGSPELGQLVQLAKDNDCDWLRLDSDVPKNEGLPLFEW